MCGACGRKVSADATLGPIRTRRDMLLVAQQMNDLVEAVPGRPIVRPTGDTWTMTCATGKNLSVESIDRLWEALLTQLGNHSSRAATMSEEMVLQLQSPSPLTRRVAQKGLDVYRSRAKSS